jgi:spore coat protein H
VIDPKDLQTIDADPSAETYVPAHLEFEGTSYGPFAARYKGNVSAYQPPCTLAGPGTPKVGKCSIKVAFDQPDSTARFFGLKKMNFTATNADPSFLRERLGYSLFREMGIAAPRNAYAHVQVNGAAVGLYVVDEQIDDRFTKHRFSDGGQGNIYKEVWPMYSDASTYEAALESNKKTPSATGILALKAAIDAGPDATEMLIDRSYTMAFVAVDRVIASDDGPFHWWCAAISQGNNPGPFGNHNYYWYEAKSADRLWLIPWDLDLSFAGNVQTHIVTPWNMTAPCECVDTVDSGVQRPAACDPLVQDFIGWMDDYNAKVDEFIAGPFSADRVNAKLDAWSTQITDAVTKYSGLNGAPTVIEWTAGVSSLRATIDTLRKNRGNKY